MEPDAPLLVSLPVVGVDRRLHDVGLLTGAVGVLAVSYTHLTLPTIYSV